VFEIKKAAFQAVIFFSAYNILYIMLPVASNALCGGVWRQNNYLRQPSPQGKTVRPKAVQGLLHSPAGRNRFFAEQPPAG
jgi:hypothetical protein